MTPAAVLSILVKTTGTQAAMAQLTKLDAAAKSSAASTDKLAAAQSRGQSSFQKTGRAAGFVALGVAAIGAASVKAAATFEQQMNTLQAVSHATGGEMKKLSKLATQLGADVHLPGTSAQDAAEAMTEMIKAGVSMKDTMAGVRSTLLLSAAAGVSNAEAAEIASNALNAFGLKGKDVALVADELANTANASSVEIRDVADAMKMAGAVFSGFQGPVLGAKGALHELNVAVGILGNAGIKGSDAGTSLKQTLLQLTGPSDKAKEAMRALYLNAQGAKTAEGQLTGVIRGSAKERAAALKSMEGNNKALQKGGDIAYTASGKMRSLKDIIALTAKGTRGMTAEQKNAYLTQIYGADATRTVIALMKAGEKGWDRMSGAVHRQGEAQKLADAKMKGFKGAVESLKSTLETLAITLGTPLLKPLATLIRGFASLLSSINPQVLGIAIGMIGGIAGALWLVVKAQAAWNALALANPVGLTIVALAALGAALVIAYKHSEGFRRVVNQAGETLKSWGATALGGMRAALAWIVTAFGNVKSAVSSAVAATLAEVKKWDVLFWVVKHALGLMLAFLSPALAVMTGVFKTWMAVTIAGFRAAWGVVRAVFRGAWTALKAIVSGGLQAVHGVIQIIGGIFKGDFHQIWEGVKNVFGGALKAIKGLLTGQLQTIVGAAKAIGEGIAGAISGAIGGAVGTIRGFVNSIIGIVNSVLGFLHLPKIPTIPGGGGGGGGSKDTGGRIGGGAVVRAPGTQTAKTSGLARGGAFARTGGIVAQPITLMGEEAPRHPEFVIPTNPAYRRRAQGLLAQAAGTIGFKKGGVLDAVGKVVDVAKTVTNPVGSLSEAIVGGTMKAGDAIRKLPSADSLPVWLRGVGSKMRGKVADWIREKLSSVIPSGGGGPAGLGSFDGLPVAKWIIPILSWARKHGWGGRITSGYRSHAHNVAQGRFYHSNHEDVQYPGGAIDVGGYGAKSEGSALATVLAGYRGARRLVWGGPVINDWGHFSATGRRKGGIFKLAKGGTYGGTVRLSSKLSPRARQFAAALAGQTGLDPGVIAAWIYSEEGGRRAPAGHGGDDNWLNVGWTDRGPVSGTRIQGWKNGPAAAARLTAQWMRGQGPMARAWGPASGGIRAILNAAGKGPSAQISAITRSGWASNAYRGGLGGVYRQLQGGPKVKTTVRGSKATKGKKITKPKVTAKRVSMADKWQAIWDKLYSGQATLETQMARAESTASLVDDLNVAAHGVMFGDWLIKQARSYAGAGVPGALEWLSNAKTAKEDWVGKYQDLRDTHPGLSPTTVAPIWRGPAEAAYAATKTDDTTTSSTDGNEWQDAIKQLAADVRVQTLRGQAIEKLQPHDIVVGWLHEVLNGRSGTAAALAAQNPVQPGVVAGGFRA